MSYSQTSFGNGLPAQNGSRYRRLNDVLLDRTGGDDTRRDGFLKDLPEVPHGGRIAGAFGQTQQQLELAPVANPRRQELCAPSVLVTYDVLKKQRRATKGKIGASDRTNLLVPVDQDPHAAQLIRRFQRGQPLRRSGPASLTPNRAVLAVSGRLVPVLISFSSQDRGASSGRFDSSGRSANWPWRTVSAANPGADHSVKKLASRASLSTRQLTRLFQSELGMTPARYVELVRIDFARAALEAGRTVAQAARLARFGSPETLRLVFLNHLGITPEPYRDRFRRFRTTGS